MYGLPQSGISYQNARDTHSLDGSPDWDDFILYAFHYNEHASQSFKLYRPPVLAFGRQPSCFASSALLSAFRNTVQDFEAEACNTAH
jgi:hypothetical protein